MQRLEVSGAVRPLQGSLGFKGLSFRFSPCGISGGQRGTGTGFFSKCFGSLLPPVSIVLPVACHSTQTHVRTFRNIH